MVPRRAVSLLTLAVAGVLALASCSDQRPFRIKNDTDHVLTLVTCAQDDNFNKALPSGATWTFGQDVGDRTLSDDPGFACLLTTSTGGILCLSVPTDQSRQTVFNTSAAKAIRSAADCFAHSDPHP